MGSATVVLRIVWDDEIDPDTLEEIAEAAEAHDSDGGLERWLGDKLDVASSALNNALPDGWYASVYEGTVDR
jgi:hypothetical protein